MKQQIATYFREYRENFRQKPFQASIVLILQILFLLGWGLFYYILIGQYIKYIIPGKIESKTPIYPESIFFIFISILYSYCFYKFFKIMFSNRYSTRAKIGVFLASVSFSILAYPLHIGIHSLFSFLPDTNTAFWCWSCGN